MLRNDSKLLREFLLGLLRESPRDALRAHLRQLLREISTLHPRERLSKNCLQSRREDPRQLRDHDLSVYSDALS